MPGSTQSQTAGLALRSHPPDQGCRATFMGPRHFCLVRTPSSTQIVFYNCARLKSNIVQAGFKITIFFNPQIYFFSHNFNRNTTFWRVGGPYK